LLLLETLQKPCGFFAGADIQAKSVGEGTPIDCIPLENKRDTFRELGINDEGELAQREILSHSNR